MKKIKNILLVIVLSLFMPLITNAAEFIVDGGKDGDVATYTIKYTPDKTPAENVTLKVDKTNDDLEYKLELLGDFGDCSALKCTLITTQITTTTEIAKLTITNPTAESKETTVTIKGTQQLNQKVIIQI